MNHCLLMMGGSGTRFGADRPKQYIEVEGKPVFVYILQQLVRLSVIDKIVIVSHDQWIDFVDGCVKKYIPSHTKIEVTQGGRSRSESVKKGLQALRRFVMNEDDIILIHDATHPYVDPEGTQNVILAAQKYGGATLGARQYDTCYRMDSDQMIEEVIPRQYLVSGASPEAFQFGLIYKIYMSASQEELDSMTSAGAIALAHQIRMAVVPSNVLNLKITYPQDMELFKLLATSYFFKDGE